MTSEPEDFRRLPRRKPARSDGTSLDRLPPHSPEAEQGVLGCILLSPKECLAQTIEKFGAHADFFYDLRHQVVYTTMIEMSNRLETIDTITLMQALKDKQQLEEVGGMAYLSRLPDIVPSSLAIGDYLAIVQDKYLLRQMIHACTDCVSLIYEHEGEVGELIDKTERAILAVRKFQSQAPTPRMKDLVHKAIYEIENYHQNQGVINGLATGFTDLDKLTMGLQPADMIVIAARPSVGKTSLAMNIADYVALELKEPVGVFSLEMTADALTMRLICSRARVNLRNIREGFLAERDFPKLTGVAGRLANAPIHIDDTKSMSIMQLRARARRMQQEFGIKIFIVDYLQLLNDADSKRRIESRQQEVASISNGIKCMAGELHVPVIVLSQLNRDLEREKNRKPRLSDLRESGAVEQDADFVGLLYKPTEKDDEDNGHCYEDCVPTNLMIAKQRNGPANVDVHLTFLKSFTRFESAAKVSDEDVPEQETMAYKVPYKE